MHSRVPVVVLFLSSFGWGLTWLPIKALNDMGLDSMHLIFIAFASGALVLLPWLYKQFTQWRLQIGFMLLIALAGGFANVSFQTAIFHGDVIRVMILFYMLPVWSVIGGHLFLKERIDRLRIIAVVLCLFGASLILDVWHSAWQSISWLDLLAIGSGIGLAATNILFRFTQDIPVMSKVSSMFLGCTVLIGISILATPTLAPLPDNGAIYYSMIYGAFWLTLISLGTQWGVTQMEAGRSAVIIVMELVAAVISAALLTHAQLSLIEISGAVLVLCAAVLEGSRDDTNALQVKHGGIPT